MRRDELSAPARIAERRDAFVAGLRYVADRPDPLVILVMLSLGGIFCLNRRSLAPGAAEFSATLVVGGGDYLTFVTAANGLVQLSTEAALHSQMMAFALGGAPTMGWVADRLASRPRT